MISGRHHARATHLRTVATAVILAAALLLMRPSPASAAPSADVVNPATFALDGLSMVALISPAINSHFMATDPTNASQVATSVAWHPFREVTITAAPYGTSPASELVPVATAGGAATWAAALAAAHSNLGCAPTELAQPVIATLFSAPVAAQTCEGNLPVYATLSIPIRILEWVADAEGALWIVRYSEEVSPTDLPPCGSPRKVHRVGRQKCTGPEAQATIAPPPFCLCLAA
jgi:hypothetical protein